MYNQMTRTSVLQNLQVSSCSSLSDLSWKEHVLSFSCMGSEKSKEAIWLCKEAVGEHNHCYRGFWSIWDS